MEYIKQYSYATDMRTLTGSKMGCQEVSYHEDGKHLLMENSSAGSGGKVRVENQFLRNLNLPPYQAKILFTNC